MGIADNTSTGKLLLNIMFAFAEYEADMIAERTSEGKAEKKATDPNYKEGRKSVKPENFSKIKKEVDAGLMSIKEAIEKMGISRSSWYKYCRG
jgi:DNA invertase Pin-like site-specific DNA recombinase